VAEVEVTVEPVAAGVAPLALLVVVMALAALVVLLLIPTMVTDEGQ
jgi:hypothetical protein